MRTKPSLRARFLEWALWRLRAKRKFARTEGLRERVLASRPKSPRPPRSFSRRFRVHEGIQGSRPVFTLSPRAHAAKGHILYLHGGAYVYEMADVQWKLMARLMERTGMEVTVPLYPLAPEHTCAEVLRFALEAFDDVQKKAPAHSIALVGDSAGGGMALAMSQQLRAARKPQPACVVLLSPWLDVTCSDPSQIELDKKDPLLASPGLREQGRWYAGDLDPTDPRVSPVYGPVDKLPPTMILTGTHDLLNADAHRLRAKFAEQSAACSFVQYTDMLHVWPAMPIPEAKTALGEVATFLATNLVKPREAPRP